jgi:hypothetical protein
VGVGRNIDPCFASDYNVTRPTRVRLVIIARSGLRVPCMRFYSIRRRSTRALGSESRVTERVLGSGFRVLIGIIGAAALGAGAIVAVTELRYAYFGSPPIPTILASLVASVVALGGAVLLRGATRGRMAVRPTRRGWP